MTLHDYERFLKKSASFLMVVARATSSRDSTPLGLQLMV